MKHIDILKGFSASRISFLSLLTPSLSLFPTTTTSLFHICINKVHNYEVVESQDYPGSEGTCIQIFVSAMKVITGAIRLKISGVFPYISWE